MTKKVDIEIVVKNKYGIHARPAAQLVGLANKFKSDIYFIKDSIEVNGKSILSIMGLVVECGSKIKIRAEGPDAEEAVNELAQLFNAKFGEE